MENKEEIRKEIYLDMILESLYDCLQFNSYYGVIDDFNIYDMRTDTMLYLLKHYDKERFAETERNIIKKFSKRKEEENGKN